jgi:hypothetical protein
MGSAGYLVGGLMAGLGQGLATVGEEGAKEQLISKEHDWKDAHDALVLRERDKYEKEKLANEQAWREKQTERGYQVAAGAAGAQRQFLTEQEKAKEAAALERTKTTGEYRVKARQAGVKPQPEWTQGHYQTQGMPDGKGGFLPGGTVLVHTNNRTHQTYVQVGNKMVPYDAIKMGARVPTAAGVRHAPIESTNELVNDPYGTAPNGQSKADVYQKAYGHLPSAYFDALKTRDPSAPPAGGPLGKAAPPGSTYVEGPSYGRSLGDAQDTEDDQQDAEDYANTGDAGPQESDNTPAQ